MSTDVTKLSTSGLQLRHGSRTWRTAVELLSSMRFAISLLVVVAIASVIGTVLEQGQPLSNYVDQFGPFWTSVFHRMDLFQVYSSWWFLAIMAVLMTSTSLCLLRNTPKIVADLRTFKTRVRERGLRAMHEHADGRIAASPAVAAARLTALLRGRGYAVRLADTDGATLVAAKIGGINRLGYILTHAAFVLICVGGMLDGDMMIRLQMLLTGKHLLTTDLPLADVPQANILSPGTPGYRGNVSIPEGGSSNIAILSIGDGSLLQPLPFTIKLNKFRVEYYSTGMPKLFASDVVITDSRSGRSYPATVKVNEPLQVDGVSIFQSGFDDGGSHLQLRAWPMQGAGAGTMDFTGDVGSSRQLSNGSTSLKLELTGFRLINVESLGNAPTRSGLMQSFDQHLGAAVDNTPGDHPVNVGPAVVYKLRDAAGQAHQYFNYMLPIRIDGQDMFVAGERAGEGDAYQYLRIPADADGRVDDWMRLRAALADPQQRARAVSAYVRDALPQGSTPDLQRQLAFTAGRTLDIFAGVIPRDPKTGMPVVRAPGGLQALGEFIERNVPKDQQQRASDVFVHVLNGVAWQLWQGERQRAGLPPAGDDAAQNRYFDSAMMALSDAVFYPAPLYLQMTGFQQVQASVFQVARAPGKVVVYGGSILLVLGVFAMLYVRERRAWFLLRDAGDGACSVLMAMSTNRRTLDFEKEFRSLRDAALAPVHTSGDAGSN